MEDLVSKRMNVRLLGVFCSVALGLIVRIFLTKKEDATSASESAVRVMDTTSLPREDALDDVAEDEDYAKQGKPSRIAAIARWSMVVIIGLLAGIGMGFVVIPGIIYYFFDSDVVVVQFTIDYDDIYDADDSGEIIQVDYEAPTQFVADFLIDPSDGDRLLDGIHTYLQARDYRDDEKPFLSLPWAPVDEIIWSTQEDRAFLDQTAIEEALAYADWFDLDIPNRFVEDPNDPDVNVVFESSRTPEICDSAKAVGCVNRIGGIYDAAGPCMITMSDQYTFDKDPLRYDASDETKRKFSLVAEMVVHEMGHCLGLIHALDGIMTAIAWEPDVRLAPSALERRVAQGILDELRSRAEVQNDSSLDDASSGFAFS